MAYISEYISDADKDRIGFSALVAGMWRPAPTRWVIDRDTSSWLIQDDWGDEDDRWRASFIFFWDSIVVRVTASGKETVVDGKIHKDWVLKIPPALPGRESQRADFCADLLLALTAHAAFIFPEGTVALIGCVGDQ
jgi:hypothetical protein